MTAVWRRELVGEGRRNHRGLPGRLCFREWAVLTKLRTWWIIRAGAIRPKHRGEGGQGSNSVTWRFYIDRVTQRGYGHTEWVPERADQESSA